MLDLTGIMFSSVMMLLVVIRAVELDRITPWFGMPDRLSKDTSPRNGSPLGPAPEVRSWRERVGQRSLRRQ